MHLTLICPPTDAEVWAVPSNASFTREAAIGLLDELRARGWTYDVLETCEITRLALETIYLGQATQAAGNRYRIRDVFRDDSSPATAPAPGLHFGTHVPALLVHQDGLGVTEVYPHNDHDGICHPIMPLLTTLLGETRAAPRS
jgi:hypothetical protein